MHSTYFEPSLPLLVSYCLVRSRVQIPRSTTWAWMDSTKLVSRAEYSKDFRWDHEKMKSFRIGEAANSGFRRMKLEHLVNDICTLASGDDVLQEVRKPIPPLLQELGSEAAYNTLPRQLWYHSFGVWKRADEIRT
jgi:hypothetical protein